MATCRELALRESEVEPLEALRLLAEAYVASCGISKTERTLFFDAGEHWLKRLRNSRHPLAAIAAKGTFTCFIPYINEDYRNDQEHYDEYDICGHVERCFAVDVAQDMLDPRRDDAFRIAFAVGFLHVEKNYNEIEL